MKTLKLRSFLTLLLFATSHIYSQNTDSDTEKEAVLKVMKSYKDALQNLTTEGTFQLFSKNSEVFESGGVEGSFSHYIEHHLGPELGHFEKFEYSNYEIDVKIDKPYAFTTETYVYIIVLKPDEKGESQTIRSKGVATSILKIIDDNWKIIKTHTSSRGIK
tara:strand:+ start:12057 stop:12539 length:483 start_codon:yes stop_codon:yes gene_type:complete